MNIEIVAPQIVDEIEFFVADKGDTGLSTAGLARLCGVAIQTMSRLLLSGEVDSAYTCPKWLEPLRDKIFYTQLEGTKGQKIVREEVAVLVIENYAFESKNKTETALNSYRKFARKGFNHWVKEITNYTENNNENKLLDAVNELIGEVKELKAETKQLKVEVGEYHKIRNTTISIYPGMNACLDMFNNDDKILAPKQDDITLAEWLKTKGVVLDKSRMHKFANLVAETYRTMTGNDPRQAMVAALNGRGASPRNVYAPREYPILEVSLAKLFNNL